MMASFFRAHRHWLCIKRSSAEPRPLGAVTEAIVNAVAHRDYTSNASVQVMLFKDRLEIWNPGRLPFGLDTDKLRKPHPSIPANPLLAEPMYLAGYIERLGTGTGDIIRLCKNAGLREPEFIQEEIFKTIIWRKESSKKDTDHDTDYDTDYDTDHVEGHAADLVIACSGEMSREDLQRILKIKHTPHFRQCYLRPAIEYGFIEMTIPDKPKSKYQKYRLSKKGMEFHKKNSSKKKY